MYSYQCPKRLWLKENMEEYEIPVIVLFGNELLKLIPEKDNKVKE